MTGATKASTSRAGRLDPDALPTRFQLQDEAGAALGSEQSVYLSRRDVVVKRRLSGLPLTISLPITAYEGVQVRVDAEGEGALRATIDLVHRDPALTLPLSMTSDMEAAAEDWQRWASALGLPMLLVELDGTLTRLPAPTPVESGPPQPRRRTGFLTKHRPRFLVRRKVGQAGEMPVMTDWREIIARN